MIAFVALLLAAPPAVETIASLEQAVADDPADVDSRLRLALRLSWDGRHDESREHAKQVVGLAPAYLDAHMLLARLDVWAEQFTSANKHLLTVLDADPNHVEAHELLVDVAIRSGEMDDAYEHINALIAKDDRAGWYERLAIVELARGDHLAARRAAVETLRRDPQNALALRVTEDVPLVILDLWTEASFLPYDEIGITESISLRAFPRHVFSISVVDEIRNRFGFTDNSVRVQGDWRAMRKLTLSAMGGFGAPSRIVPKWVASVIAAGALTERLDVSATVRFEDLPIAARLLRGRLDVGFALHGPLRAEAAASLGVLDYTDDSDVVRLFQVSVAYVGADLELRARYVAGNEMDLLLDPSNPAFIDPNQFIVRLSSHTVGGSAAYRFNRYFSLLLGFDAEFRSDQQRSYHTRARLSFAY